MLAGHAQNHERASGYLSEERCVPHSTNCKLHGECSDSLMLRWTDRTRHRNFLELFRIGLGATLDEPARVVAKLKRSLNYQVKNKPNRRTNRSNLTTI